MPERGLVQLPTGLSARRNKATRKRQRGRRDTDKKVLQSGADIADNGVHLRRSRAPVKRDRARRRREHSARARRALF